MLLGHSATYFLSRGLGALFTLASLWLFSRLFTPAQYGHYTTVMAAAAVLNLGVMQALRVTLLRFLPGAENPHAVRQAGLVLFAALMALTLLGAGLAAPLLSPQSRALVPAVLAVGWSMAWAELGLDLLRSALAPRAYLRFALLRDALMLGLTVALAKAGWGSMALLLGVALGHLLPTLFTVRALQLWRVPSGLAPALLSQMLRYGLPLGGVYLVAVVTSSLDRLLIPQLIGPAANGLYGAAGELARQSLFLLMQAANLAAFPLAVQALQRHGVEAARVQMQQNLTLLLAIGLPGLVGLALLAPLLSATLLGPSFAPFAAALMPWLALAGFAYGLRVFYADQAFQLAGQNGRAFVLSLLGLGVSLPLYVGFITAYGLSGAAYALAASNLFSLGLSLLVGRRAFALPWPRAELLLILFGTLLMALVLWPQREGQGAISLLLALMTGGGTFALCMLAGNLLGVRTALRQRLARAPFRGV